jgi:hypothetical protein
MGIELPLLVKTNFIDCYEDSRLGWDLDTKPLNTKSQFDKTKPVMQRSWEKFNYSSFKEIVEKINITPHNTYQYLQMPLFFHPDQPL